MYCTCRAYVLLQCILLGFAAELNNIKKEKLLFGFIEYLNTLPNQPYNYEDGIFLDSQQKTLESNYYTIDVNLKASEIKNLESYKLLKCWASIQDLEKNINIDSYNCQEVQAEPNISNLEDIVSEDVYTNTDTPLISRRVVLDNEVQSDTIATSGEQFIAVPRVHPTAPCIGCASQVNTDAAGVKELALLGVKQLDRQDPSVKHSLVKVNEVERQVQVVSGVRYIVTLEVAYDNCSSEGSIIEGCLESKVCKISVLEKPWVKLPDGSKHRVIVANNCTAQWLFDENGEVILEPNSDTSVNNFDGNDIIKPVHNFDSQSVQKKEKTLNEGELKDLETQIIPNSEFQSKSGALSGNNFVNNNHEISEREKELHTLSAPQNISHKESLTEPEVKPTTTNSLLIDKKKTIDDLENFFNFPEVDTVRVKRSNDNGLLATPADNKFNHPNYSITKSRKKRFSKIVGNAKPVDVKDPTIQSLAIDSLQKIVQYSENPEHYDIVNISLASVQVVAGTLTKINFELAKKDCNNTMPSKCEIVSCYSKIWEQPWLDKKDITLTCDSLEKKQIVKRSLKNISNDNGLSATPVANKFNQPNYSITKSRKKRFSKIVGNAKPVDVKDPTIQSLAIDSLQKIVQYSENPEHYEIVNISLASVQVVAGKLTNINFEIAKKDCNNTMPSKCEIVSCYSKIWEQPWLDKKDITLTCDSLEKKQIVKRSLKKRQLDSTFEYNSTDTTNYLSLAEESLQKYIMNTGSKKYRNLIEEALQKYQNKNHSKYKFKVFKLNNVVYQNYDKNRVILDFLITPNKCFLLHDEIDLKDCPEPSINFVLRCHAHIWIHDSEKNKQIIVNCKQVLPSKHSKYNAYVNKSNKRQLHPDEDFIDDDTKYFYADKAVQYLNSYSESQNLQKLITIHSIQTSMQMKRLTVQMYLETASTFCLRHEPGVDLNKCDELDGLSHKLCFARLWPATEDELMVEHISVICDDDENFESVSDLSLRDLLVAAMKEIEKSPDIHFKLVHQGEPVIIPSLESNVPTKLSFIVSYTNCTKDTDLEKYRSKCFVDSSKSYKECHSFIWMAPNSKKIKEIQVMCGQTPTKRVRRSLSLDPSNATEDELFIQSLIKESLEKLELSSLHRYKQRVLKVNGYSSKVTTGKVTTIDFDVGYTSCLKYEWVENITRCEFLKHLPMRHCIAQVWQRLWLGAGQNIEVNCDDYETTLGSKIDLENDEIANQLANESLKRIEAKYPHPLRQKVIRIFSLEKQIVAGIHYRMKIEIGPTDCPALSVREDCKLSNDGNLNKFCRVNVWLRPWTDHAPNFRVSCDYQETATDELYYTMQAEHLFKDFLETHKPPYVDNNDEMLNRFKIFKNNVRKIHELNINEKGTAKYAVTKFSDLTYHEFSSKYLGLKTNLRNFNNIPMRQAPIPSVSLPSAFDWRDHGAVTKVKNQGSCGSCWAFSVTGNIEGQWKIKSGNLVSLSEQELVDCDKLDQGCNGGLPDNAYRAIEQIGGLEMESDYPYEGENDKCAFNNTLTKIQISGAFNISSNETNMAKWLVMNGPISIGINANAMQFYVGGVSHPWKMLCNPGNLDHGVLIVGYGVKDYPLFHKRLPYWIVKNSWGPWWGEQGYYRVYRGDGTCGVNNMASSAVI